MEFDETLDLRACADVEEPSPVYKLHSVLVHTGATATTGHYYAYIRPSCAGELWLRCNDAAVETVGADVVFAETSFGGGVTTTDAAYMLMYVRESDVAVVCGDVAWSEIPQALRQHCDAEIEDNMRRTFLMSVRYCTDVDMRQLPDKGLLLPEECIRDMCTVDLPKTATFAALRAAVAAKLQCEPVDVLLLSYLNHPPHGEPRCQPFATAYEDDDALIARVQSVWISKYQPPDTVVFFGCRRSSVIGASGAVIVVKQFCAGTARISFVGLVRMDTDNCAAGQDLYRNVRDLMAVEAGTT